MVINLILEPFQQKNDSNMNYLRKAGINKSNILRNVSNNILFLSIKSPGKEFEIEYEPIPVPSLSQGKGTC